MSIFRELYDADIARYGAPGFYLRIFHFLYRKASVASFTSNKIFYKTAFRVWANRRGLELSANQQIGGTVFRPRI